MLKSAMQLSKICPIILALITSLCLAQSIIQSVKLDYDMANRITVTDAVVSLNNNKRNTISNQCNNLQVQVFKSCYKDVINVVGIAGNSSDLISKKLWVDGHFSVTTIDNTTRIVNNATRRLEFPYKLQVFVITARSLSGLENILRYVKKSLWWNHMATFLILGDPTSKYECSNAHDILWTAWKMDLLHGKFLCLDLSNRTLIYSYNPYSVYAPDPWKFVNLYPGKNNHPWSLFVGNYRELISKNCQNFEFKTTNDLNGYEISYTATDRVNLWHMEVNKTGIDAFGGGEGRQAYDIYRALNASARFVRQFGANWKSTLNEGIEDSIELLNERSDIVLNRWYLTDILNISMLYPLWESGLSVITQYRGHESQLSKIWRVIDNISWIGVCVVTLITLIFLKYYLRQPLIVALLNIIRLACNASLPEIPQNLAVRIYLAYVFIFIVTMQGVFQGKLASLLTKEVLLPNVDTLQQLVDSDYVLYFYEGWLSSFADGDFKGRLVAIPSVNCVEYVLKDPMAACLRGTYVLLYQAAQCKLHLSREYIYKNYYTYAIRENWPLEQRLNEILSSLTESSILEYKLRKDADQQMQIIKVREMLYEDQGFQIITLGELSFAFAILGIGLGCATVTFIIEIVLNRDREARIGNRIKIKFAQGMRILYNVVR